MERKNQDNSFSDEIILPIEDSIDLHTFHPGDIPEVVEEYLYECIRLNYKEVRIIHGRGKGYQRAVVHKILAQHPQVLSFQDAPYERGGWGAAVVRLKIK
ncbi:MAG TPA: Smr/MutS family protein [Candidatus Eremiobacteraeota bacterium]|nr:MAG: Endonuclease MutS2 [bacterium ADurb.Bin363]OQA18412.1 MAG: Endonuclease MutS2 [bacterium ADurb.Bin363]HPZ07959.1 Smr/MutS family protein [Candidatus Eremiobacteraeota bacterium]